MLAALGRACWVEEKNIADGETLVALADSIGLKGRELLQLAGSDAVVAEFNHNTEQAIAADVFGVPWYRVDGEGFWGQDRLDFVERALAIQ